VSFDLDIVLLDTVNTDMLPPSDYLADNELIPDSKEHVNIALAMHPESLS
jgi:hypothetical protein